MLVLRRKQREGIFISDNVVVAVLRMRGDHMTIGIDAPSGVSVHRKEIFEKINGQDVQGFLWQRHQERIMRVEPVPAGPSRATRGGSRVTTSWCDSC